MNKLIDEDVIVTNSILGNNIWIRAGTDLLSSKIGSDVFINFRCQIQNAEIGSHSQIASKVSIGGLYHSTKIGNNTWIGADTIVLEGVSIGCNCVIGAYTIVAEDIPDDSIVYGREQLTIKKRNCTDDGMPNFQNALENNLKLKEKGQYLKKSDDGNYISASLTGAPKRIGRNNILIGNKYIGGGIFFDENVEIGNDNIFEGAGQIILSQDVQIGNNVHIISNSHDYNYSSLPMTLLPVIVGKGVIIKDSAMILGGVSIPDHTIIEEKQFIRKI